MGQTGCFADCREILLDITRIIRLMKALREELEETVIGWLVAALKQINEDETPAGFQHAGEFAEDDAGTLGGSSWNMKMLVIAS